MHTSRHAATSMHPSRSNVTRTAMVGLVAALSFSVGAAAGSPFANSAPTRAVSSGQGTDRVIQPGQVLQFSSTEQAELRALTSTPDKDRRFSTDLAHGVAAFGLRLRTTGPAATKPTLPLMGGASSTNTMDTSFTVEPVLASGWSGSHWWLTMSYSDAAYGGIAAATAACAAYLPGFICGAIAGIAGAWVNGYSKASNHGVWLVSPASVMGPA